jgi:hypothetical protein
MNPQPQTPTISLELTPKMARFLQWLQDQQASQMKTPANDQIWDYITALNPTETED